MDVVVVEDQPIYRRGLVGIMEKAGHRVVGETGSGSEAIRLCASLRPRLLLLDLELPDLDGFAVGLQARGSTPALRILALTAHFDDYTLVRIERAGFQGYLDKAEATAERIGVAASIVGNGGCAFSDCYQIAKRARDGNVRAWTRMVSDREETVLGLAALGLSDQQIGAELGISPSTVHFHRHNLFRKLNVRDSMQLMAFAFQHGFTHWFSKAFSSASPRWRAPRSPG